MKKFLKITVLCCLVLSIFSSMAFAEKSEFKDSNYNFTQIRSIPFSCNISDENKAFVDNEYADKVAKQALLENAKKKLLPLLDSNNLEKQYSTLHSEYVQQKLTDPESAKSAFSKYIKDNYDAKLIVSIKKYHYEYVQHEGYTYESTEYEEIKIQNSDGTWTTISKPYKKTHYVDPWTEKIAVVKIEFKLEDNKTGEVVFARTDEKSSSGGVFSSPNVDNVAKKLCESYVNDLSKMVKDK